MEVYVFRLRLSAQRPLAERLDASGKTSPAAHGTIERDADEAVLRAGDAQHDGIGFVKAAGCGRIGRDRHF